MIPIDKLANIYNTEWCRRHRKRPLRTLDMLRNRELGVRRPGTQLLSGAREFYQCLKLKYTSRIHSTSTTPMRFTPDGKQIICYNTTAQEIKVYWYNGVTSIRNPTGPNAESLFTGHFSVQIHRFERGVNLCRDLCLVTDDSKHLILAYTVPVPEQQVNLQKVRKNNESMIPNGTMEHTVFVSIDLNKGIVCHSVRCEYDSIRVSGGVYLVDRLFGVLSTLHQSITLFKIDPISGKFSKITEIGQSLYEDDEFYLSAVPSGDPHTDKVFTGFRHRLLTFLYMKHKRASTSKQFLRSIHHYKLLRMHKMQFLGPDLILLRLGVGLNPDSSGRRDEEKSPCMFVIFDWRKTEILAMFNRCSEKLFKLFVDYTETFRHGSITNNAFPTTMEYCQLLRQHHDSIIEAWVASSSPESAIEVRNRVLNVLPCSGIGTPVFTPFLDAHLFSFEERLLPCIENARFTTSSDFRIFCRKTCSPALCIDFAEFVNPDVPCRILFHPTDPLMLLCERFCSESPLYIFTPPLEQVPC